MQWSRLTLALGIVAFLLLLIAGPGSRLGLWHFTIGFSLLKWGAYLGIATAVLTLVVLFVVRPLRPHLPLLAVALGLGAIAFLVPWGFMRQARAVPPIHDITTDPENPPVFVAVLPLRADAPNPSTYGGAEVAAQQQRGYPDIHPLQLPVPPPVAFARALSAAERMGWEIVAADSAEGRIEATATTAWFGFKDDVVVRIRPEGAGSQIDVRSVSRVGKSDVGANAKRVKTYFAKLAV